MPATITIVRRLMRRSPVQTRGTSASTTLTISMRCQTSGSASSEISLPRMPVNPQHRTHRCICNQARSWAESDDMAPEAYTTRAKRGSGRPRALGRRSGQAELDAGFAGQNVDHGQVLAEHDETRAGRDADRQVRLVPVVTHAPARGDDTQAQQIFARAVGRHPGQLGARD